jgi:hypothetical protein
MQALPRQLQPGGDGLMELVGQIALAIIVMFVALWAWSVGYTFVSSILRAFGRSVGIALFGWWVPMKGIQVLAWPAIVVQAVANYLWFAVMPLAFVAFFGGWFQWGWAEPAATWAWYAVGFGLIVEITSGIPQGAIFGWLRRQGSTAQEAKAELGW